MVGEDSGEGGRRGREEREGGEGGRRGREERESEGSDA